MSNEPNMETQAEPVKAVFKVSRLELIAALIMYVAAYIYISILFEWEPHTEAILMAIFVATLVGITELCSRNHPRKPECWFWLGCLSVCTVAFLIHPEGSIWNAGQIVLFIHMLGVWYVLNRTNALLDGETGHLLPADLFNGLILGGFGQIFLRVRVIVHSIKNHFRGEKTRRFPVVLGIIGSVIVALLLLVGALGLLSQADETYARLVERLLDIFVLDVDFDEVILRFIISVPIGGFLFGLVAGSSRTAPEKIMRRKNSMDSFLRRIRILPPVVWIAIIGLFSVFYLAFFFIQGKYLFGAFTRTLPEGFVVSQYAREGFFELCRITALNFTVLWFATRLSSAVSGKDLILKVVCTVFLAENSLFCVIALSKLALYIDCFGFTPLRFQSTWLVLTLLAACIFWILSLYVKGKKHFFRTWLAGSATALCILTLF